MVAYLVKNGYLKTNNIIKAFEKIDRKDFVLPEYQSETYDDYPLPIGFGQTISQPSTVAFMIELLRPKKGDNILDVGSGSGWTTALLAEISGGSGIVWGVELMPQLAEFGRGNLKKYGFKNAEIILADGKLGLPAKAPFDKILVSAFAYDLPQFLVQQLKPGGTIVLPIGSSVWKIDKNKKGIIKQEFEGYAFVPLK